MITAQQLTINTDINTILNTLSNASNVDIQLVLTKLYNYWEVIVRNGKYTVILLLNCKKN